MKVRVVAYNNRIVLVPENPEQGINQEWWPTGGTRIGCVVGNTKANLGVSEEALVLMRKMRVCRDAIGDLNWWWCTDGTYAFSWIGPIHRIVDPDTSEAARGFEIFRDQCTIIPNDVPPEAIAVIDDHPRNYAWREPHAVAYPPKP
jgi:hypothetical protein